jgi:hypothetical protein
VNLKNSVCRRMTATTTCRSQLSLDIDTSIDR